MAWADVGRYVRQARSRRRQTQAEFADEIGLSTRLVGSLEAGESRAYDATTLDRIEDALGWGHGSVERVVQGGAPVVNADPDLARIVSAWPRLTPVVRRILAELVGVALRTDD